MKRAAAAARAGRYWSARPSNPDKKRDMWNYGLDDRDDAYMEAQRREEEKARWPYFLAELKQEMRAEDLHAVTRGMNKQMSETPEQTLYRLERELESVKQDLETKATEIAMVEAEKNELTQQLRAGLLTPDENDKLTRLNRQLGVLKSEQSKMWATLREVSAEKRAQHELVHGASSSSHGYY